jgi:aminocarboxymuconate-semialdehyde decarboxylase
MKTIDLDSHSRQRAQDYQVSDQYSHLVPQSYKDQKGNVRHLFNDRLLLSVSQSEISVGDQQGRSGWEPANYDGPVRYDQVTAAGIDLQFVSTGSVAMFSYCDAQLGGVFCRSANDFIYNTFVKPYPKRFTGVPQLPHQDITECGKELERCVKELGMLAVRVPTNWDNIDISEPYWWSFWDEVRELGICSVLVHIAALHGPWLGKERFKVLGPDGTTGRRIVTAPFEYSANIINLIFGGMMDNFPELRFAFLEAGAEFAIVIKHRVEENLEQLPDLAEKLAHPLEWYFDRFYFLLDDRMLEQNGKLLRYAVDELGADHLFLGSDYPHHDGHLDTFGRVKELSWLANESKEKILGKNAETLIGRKLI